MKKLIILSLLFLHFSFKTYSGSQNSPLLAPVDPIGNSSNPDKIMLGKVLYWDEQLSSSKTVACASCHILSSGGTDPRANSSNPSSINPGFDEIFNTADDITGSPGVPASNAQGEYIYNAAYGFEPQVTNRSAPTAINAGYAISLFWDGRATEQLIDPISNAMVLSTGAALEAQILAPPTNPVEMAHEGRDWNDIVKTIKMSSPLALSPSVSIETLNWINTQSYFQLFDKAFGDTQITAVKIAMAIASYERSLFANQSPFDAFNAGDTSAMTFQEKVGLNMFRTQGCDTCHSNAIFSDHDFHNTGVTADATDNGRYSVTGLISDMGRFKTPSLRNLQSRNSFMHNGRFETLSEVIDFYNRGGDFSNPNLDTRIQPMFLSETQKSSLVAFLGHALTDQRVINETGPFSSPSLYAQSDRVPTISGSGIAGSNAKTPILTAVEPPLLGNSSFTIAIENALTSSLSTLVIDTSDPGTSSPPDANNSLIHMMTTLANNNGDGYASLSVVLPNHSAMNGTTLYGRWYVEDISANNGYAISPLLEFTLFSPNFGQAGLIFSDSFD